MVECISIKRINPNNETEHYIDVQHNGGVYNSFNLNTNVYCYQSPIILIDPNGKQVWTRILGGVKAVGGAFRNGSRRCFTSNTRAHNGN